MALTINIQQAEANFINACISNEEWAQKKLYEDHYSIMYPVCLRYATDSEEALDILHEGFIKVFRHMSKYTIGTSLKAWIKRIMVNTAIDFYRKRSRRRTEDIDNAISLSTDSPDVVSSMSATEILAALQKLSPAYRSVFNLYIIEGFSHKEVADKLNISESTSRSNLVKARQKLKKILLSNGTIYGQ
jgi:RNA polymerase sigma factor (sigma-70 family)